MVSGGSEVNRTYLFYCNKDISQAATSEAQGPLPNMWLLVEFLVVVGLQSLAPRGLP